MVAASTEALQRFDRVDSLLALPRNEAYDVLVELEPRLAAVAAEAKTGRLGYRLDAPDFKHARTRSERDTVMRQAMASEESLSFLTRALDPLIGPAAESTDELLRTNAARDVAESHLDDLRPSGDAV